MSEFIILKKSEKGNVIVKGQTSNKTLFSIPPGQIVVADINNTNNIIIKSTANPLENGFVFNIKDIAKGQCIPPIVSSDRSGIINELSENFFFELNEGGKEVEYFNSFYEFPVTGLEDVIYVDKKEFQMYYWDGNFYIDYCLDNTRVIKIQIPPKSSANNWFCNLLFPNMVLNSLVQMEFQSSTSGSSVTKTFQIVNNNGNLTGTTSTVDKIKGSGFDYAIGEIFFQVYPILSVEHKLSSGSTLSIKIRRLSGNLNLKQINTSAPYESSIVIPENKETSKFLPSINTTNKHKLIGIDPSTKELCEVTRPVSTINGSKKIIVSPENVGKLLMTDNNFDSISQPIPYAGVFDGLLPYNPNGINPNLSTNNTFINGFPATEWKFFENIFVSTTSNILWDVLRIISSSSDLKIGIYKARFISSGFYQITKIRDVSSADYTLGLPKEDFHYSIGTFELLLLIPSSNVAGTYSVNYSFSFHTKSYNNS